MLLNSLKVSEQIKKVEKSAMSFLFDLCFSTMTNDHSMYEINGN